MDNETKARVRHAVSMLAGFCTEEGPEAWLVGLVDAALEGDTAKARMLAEEATAWVLAWEKRQD